MEDEAPFRTCVADRRYVTLFNNLDVFVGTGLQLVFANRATEAESVLASRSADM
jgi:hypothetical protein